MKPIPRAIRMNGRTYNIRRASTKWITKRADDDSPFEVEGLCEPTTSTIWLADELSLDRAWGSLEHEAGHGAAEESGARHTILRGNLNTEEKLIRTWLPVYLEALRTGLVW